MHRGSSIWQLLIGVLFTLIFLAGSIDGLQGGRQSNS